MTDDQWEDSRSYGCTYACGNPFDFVLIDVQSGTTEFLCLPDLIRLASQLVEAMTESASPDVAAALAYAVANPETPTPGPAGKRGRRNAPATNTDPGVFDAFDSTITAEELGEEFQ